MNPSGGGTVQLSKEQETESKRSVLSEVGVGTDSGREASVRLVVSSAELLQVAAVVSHVTREEGVENYALEQKRIVYIPAKRAEWASEAYIGVSELRKTKTRTGESTKRGMIM